jgi:hypothetical protein
MRQLHQYVCRSGLVLVTGLLTMCGTPSLPSANVPLQATNHATDTIGTSIAPSIPYPEPYPAPQRPLTDQQAQAAGPTSATLSPAPVLGVVVDPHRRVLSVDVSSAAETAGIQSGDQLETLDGIPLDSQTQNVKERIRTAREDQSMRLTVRRGATIIEVIVVPFPAHPLSGSTVEPGHPASTPTPVAPTNDYL